MIQYMQEGNYTFNSNMRLEYANITLLDLHVHAYVVGKKYDVTKLCDHAIGEYLNIAGMVLSIGVPPRRRSYRLLQFYCQRRPQRSRRQPCDFGSQLLPGLTSSHLAQHFGQ